MELFQLKRAGKSAFIPRPQEPSDCSPTWQVKRKLHNDPTREHTKELQRNERAQSPLLSDRTECFSEAQESGDFQSIGHPSLDGDRNPLALERHLESRGEADTQLLLEDREGIRRGLLAEKHSVLPTTQQPQIFNLSANLSRGDALTERATENPDIYEVDWHNLEFKPLFSNEARAHGPPSASSPVTSFENSSAQKETAQEQLGSAYSSSRHSPSCYPSDLHVTALHDISSEPIHEQISSTPTNSWARACSPFPLTWLTASDVFSNGTRTSESTVTRRAASCERTRRRSSSEPYSRTCSWSHRGRSAPPETSAGVRQAVHHLESGSSKYAEVSGASAALHFPTFPCHPIRTFLSARHTFLRLETINFNGTPLKSELVQAFATLVRLKHLTLANCSLKDISFLSNFVSAVPLQRLIVPFNQIATLPFIRCAQPAFSSAHDDVKSGSASICIHNECFRTLLQRTLRAVVDSEVNDVGADRRKHRKAAGRTGDIRPLVRRGQTNTLQCGQDTDVVPGGAEGQLRSDISAADPDAIYQEHSLRKGLADTVRAEKSAAEPITQQEPTLYRPSEKENLFPNSMRVVDLSYNCLGDARELLPFCSQFKELREIKICGNFCHTVRSSLLQQIGCTLRSNGTSFLCQGELAAKEKKHVFLEAPPHTCTCTLLAARPEEKTGVPCSPFCQKFVDVRKVKEEDTSSPGTSPRVGDTLQHLQQLVKQLAREKATLAQELKQVRQQTVQGERERPSAGTKIRDGDEDLSATPHGCDEISCMGGRFGTGRREFSLRQCHKADNDERKAAGVDVSVCKGKVEIEDNARCADARELLKYEYMWN